MGSAPTPVATENVVGANAVSNETLFAITVSILSLIGVLASAWLQLRGKRGEVLEKQLDSAG